MLRASSMSTEEQRDFLQNYDGRPLRFMEVCGSHTEALARSGVRDLLSPKITLISGPGCPVCVTPSTYIDRLIELSREENVLLMVFGDLLRIPGTKTTLMNSPGYPERVKLMRAPLEALRLAKEHPEKKIVVAGVGFETTAPSFALLLKRAKAEGLKNLKILPALKTMPEPLLRLCKGDIHVDGFLAPGHVSVIIGLKDYRALEEKYHKSFVVGGFTYAALLRALTDLVLLASEGKSAVWNDYESVVCDEGSPAAQKILDEVFTKEDAMWRGLGCLPDSGYKLREEYASFLEDWDFMAIPRDPKGCSCGEILLGRMAPEECPLFGKACTTEHPVGPCMMSAEGSCGIRYQYGGSDD